MLLEIVYIFTHGEWEQQETETVTRTNNRIIYAGQLPKMVRVA